MNLGGPRVIVVGAGAVGLCAALALADRGARVRVIDAAARIMAPSDRSASARAAGLLAPFSETLKEPPETHPGLLAMGAESLGAWPDLIRRVANGAPDWLLDRRGALVVAQGGPFAAQALKLQKLAREHGASTRLIPKKEVAERAPAITGKIDFGVMIEAEAQVRPGPLMVALLRALKAATGEEVRVAEAQALLVEAGRCVGVRVRPRSPAEPSEERADAVLLAPGAWAPATLAAEVPALSRVAPMKGHLIEVATPPGALPLPVRSEKVYALPRGPRLTRIGATMEPGKRDHAVDPMSVRTLQEGLAEMAPALAAAPVLSQWAGVRAMSPDWAPMIGPSGPAGCFVACGMSRNGWLLAPVVARYAAEAILGDAPAEAHAFRPDRFG